jgi:hypothetical protein
MEKRILFIAPYPTENTIKDGYIQRIMNIDNLVSNIQREYMYVRSNPFGKTEKRIVAGINIYRMNCFRAGEIKRLINSYKYIYIHSIYMYRSVCKYIKNYQTTILDFHGVIPEELAYNKKYLSSMYYSHIEKKAAKNIDFIIFVTEVMANYFNKKYPKSKAIPQIFPIIAKNALIEKKINIDSVKLNIKDPIIFIYSGNNQKWQNVPEMFDFIKKNDEENHIYIFLSKEKEYFINVVNTEFKKIKDRFIVDSVLPEELYKYYSIAHYGFLIRGDHILNKVACPTKMIEYLFYGITPIVKLKEIGDFFDYESIRIFDEKIEFKPHRSKKNKQLAMYMLRKYSNNNPFDKIFSYSNK